MTIDVNLTHLGPLTLGISAAVFQPNYVNLQKVGHDIVLLMTMYLVMRDIHDARRVPMERG